MYDRLIDKAKQIYPNISVKSSKEFFSWFNNVAPNFILENVVECKTLKSCGSLSSKFSIMALSYGFPCFTLYGPGHITNVIITSDDLFEIDFSHLQFLFPSKGSLRDFPADERDSDEFIKMKQIFEEIEKNPMMAVKVEKIKNINPDYLNIEKDVFAKTILNLFKQASSLIFQ